MFLTAKWLREYHITDTRRYLHGVMSLFEFLILDKSDVHDINDIIS